MALFLLYNIAISFYLLYNDSAVIGNRYQLLESQSLPSEPFFSVSIVTILGKMYVRLTLFTSILLFEYAIFRTF